MTGLRSGNPVRTMFWLFRGVGILLLVVGLLRGERLVSEFTAILVASLVLSFFGERRLLSHIATRMEGAGPLPAQDPGRRKFADAYFAFIVGSMRVIGGTFVVCGIGMVAAIVLNWAESMRDFGGLKGIVAAFLVLSTFVGLGVLLLLGHHVPLMRSLDEMGKQWRRKG